jgi:membrane-associated phospholipid phosphatase
VLVFVAAQVLEVLYKANLHHLGPPRTVAHADGPSITDLVSGTGPLANSFPSGHMVRAVIAYGLIAFVVQRLAPWPLARTLAAPIATVLIVLVAFDRLYLDVHWESDVLGGRDHLARQASRRELAHGLGQPARDDHGHHRRPQ